MTNQEIESKLTDCQEVMTASNSPFNEWEDEFIESTVNQFEKNKGLSPKQQEILCRLWDKI